MAKSTKKPEQQTETTADSTPAEPKVIDMSKPNIQEAISIGKEMSKTGEATKAEVARKMYECIKDESREIIVQAFIQGANLTPAGAQTYYYNVKRKAGKS